METPHSAKWSINQMLTSINGTKVIYFDYPIQRSGDQWSLKNKGDLIHSILYGFPIPPLYFLRFKEERDGKPVPIRQVLDGKQRLTTINSYYQNEFAIGKNVPLVTIDGVEFDVSGKKFEELEEVCKNAFLGFGIPNYTLDSDFWTDEEIELLFHRMNNAKPLTVHQKAKSLMGVRFSTLLNDVAEHRTIHELSNFPASQIRDNKHQAMILQTMMILENYDYRSFSAKATSAYSETVRNDYDNKVELLNKAEKALDYLGEVFEKKEKFLLKPISFPITLSLAYHAKERNIAPDIFYLWSTAFTDAVNGVETSIPTNYLEYTNKGSTDLVKVKGRISEMHSHFEQFIELLNKEIVSV